MSVVCRAFSSLWQKLSEIRAPALHVGTRLTQETGSVRNYQDLPRQMEVKGAKQAHKDDRAEWLMQLFGSLHYVNVVKTTQFHLGDLTHGKL